MKVGRGRGGRRRGEGGREEKGRGREGGREGEISTGNESVYIKATFMILCLPAVLYCMPLPVLSSSLISASSR